MSHDEREPTSRFEPWKRRAGRPIDQRRHELFEQAAPVFRRHGYRGATIKQLAHACHLSPAGLYHYFGSKQEFATYPLNRPRLDWESTHVDRNVDPLVQLRELIDLSIRELPTYVLALQLASEVDLRPDHVLRARAFGEGEAVFGRILMSVDPGMKHGTAVEMARHLLALLAGSAFTGLDPAADAAVRSRMLEVLRRSLVPAVIDADRFDRTMAADPA